MPPKTKKPEEHAAAEAAEPLYALSKKASLIFDNMHLVKGDRIAESILTRMPASVQVYFDKAE